MMTVKKIVPGLVVPVVMLWILWLSNFMTIEPWYGRAIILVCSLLVAFCAGLVVSNIIEELDKDRKSH